MVPSSRPAQLAALGSLADVCTHRTEIERLVAEGEAHSGSTAAVSVARTSFQTWLFRTGSHMLCRHCGQHIKPSYWLVASPDKCFYPMCRLSTEAYKRLFTNATEQKGGGGLKLGWKPPLRLPHPPTEPNAQMGKRASMRQTRSVPFPLSITRETKRGATVPLSLASRPVGSQCILSDCLSYASMAGRGA